MIHQDVICQLFQ
uniref:Uncharacterized protein n=1 Tax=Anguilla anguilla TaxID=7936 RepID=A0A0E9TPC9_ANGAN